MFYYISTVFFVYLNMYFVFSKYIVCFSGQTRTYRRKNSPCKKDKSGTNAKADPPLNVSKDYILFSPTRIAAAMRKAKLQQSLQNQSASVLTAPSGLDFSGLNDTLPQPGGGIFSVIVRGVIFGNLC